MINAKEFLLTLFKNGFDTFFGVPDSLLKDMCACLVSGAIPVKNIIAANEGNAVALASGSYMATGRPAVVYMQNSGLGNAVNPLISLADEEVYKIPMLLLIGWRGEPGIKDEPQHVKQGGITLPLLDTLGIKHAVLSENYEEDIVCAKTYLETESKSFALVIRKNMFNKFPAEIGAVPFSMSREEALSIILERISKHDVIVGTTGKTSREIFEIRKRHNDTHERDFLTVGSMGHASSVALGVSLATEKKVYCFDGDGAMIMHLGALAIAAQNAAENFKYILINNGAHESVGGQPTVGFQIDTAAVLKGFGFENVFSVADTKELSAVFAVYDKTPKSALIVNVRQGSRADLGRPDVTPQENKAALMRFIKRGN